MDLVAMGEIELGEIMVGVDEFWAQEELHMTVHESMGPDKVCLKSCSPTHSTQRCIMSAERSVKRNLTST